MYFKAEKSFSVLSSIRCSNIQGEFQVSNLIKGAPRR